MTGRIIQFGTSRFLQAHADLFVHEARQAGQDVGKITVVQTTAAPERAERIAAFGRPEGFPVLIRGIENGVKIDRRVDVLSVDRGLSALADWDELAERFVHAELVISNTGDRGYEIAPEDGGETLLSGHIPSSFPGKLTALLHRRWRDGARPLTVMPCELINQNGHVLDGIVRALAAQSGAAPAFAQWIESKVAFADTLVDRIVPQALEPIGAVAEPYALWAIKRAPGVDAPCTHAAIVMTDNLDPYERLKLHILNLGHTILADVWLAERREPDETVRGILNDADVAGLLADIYRSEVLPGFAAQGMRDEAEYYVRTTIDRFKNPFVNHRLSDIAQNHAVKVERRLAAFLKWVGQSHGSLNAPRLAEIIARQARRITSADARH